MNVTPEVIGSDYSSHTDLLCPNLGRVLYPNSYPRDSLRSRGRDFNPLHRVRLYRRERRR